MRIHGWTGSRSSSPSLLSSPKVSSEKPSAGTATAPLRNAEGCPRISFSSARETLAGKKRFGVNLVRSHTHIHTHTRESQFFPAGTDGRQPPRAYLDKSRRVPHLSLLSCAPQLLPTESNSTRLCSSDRLYFLARARQGRAPLIQVESLESHSAHASAYQLIRVAGRCGDGIILFDIISRFLTCHQTPLSVSLDLPVLYYTAVLTLTYVLLFNYLFTQSFSSIFTQVSTRKWYCFAVVATK